MELSDGVHFTILLSLCYAQYRRVTDGQTDGQTDGRTRRCRKDPRQHSVARVKMTILHFAWQAADSVANSAVWWENLLVTNYYDPWLCGGLA